MRPHELRELRWHAIGEHVLSVPTNTKTDDRPVRLLDPLRRDLAEWRLRCGRPSDIEFVVPAERESLDAAEPTQWSANGFSKWARAASCAPPRWL